MESYVKTCDFCEEDAIAKIERYYGMITNNEQYEGEEYESLSMDISTHGRLCNLHLYDVPELGKLIVKDVCEHCTKDVFYYSQEDKDKILALRIQYRSGKSLGVCCNSCFKKKNTPTPFELQFGKCEMCFKYNPDVFSDGLCTVNLCVPCRTKVITGGLSRCCECLFFGEDVGASRMLNGEIYIRGPLCGKCRNSRVRSQLMDVAVRGGFNFHEAHGMVHEKKFGPLEIAKAIEERNRNPPQPRIQYIAGPQGNGINGFQQYLPQMV